MPTHHYRHRGAIQLILKSLRCWSQSAATGSAAGSASAAAGPATVIGRRSMCSSNEESTVLVDMNDETGIATLSLNRKPVNSLNREFMESINSTLKDLERDKSKGVVITSALPSVFCAGLDLTQLSNPDPDQLRAYWRANQQLWMTSYGLRIPSACVISGHSPAAGVQIATACDYRVMVDGKYKIGLNEAAFGLVVPPFLKDAFVNTVGHRNAELGLTLGKLFTVDEALGIGLVDQKAASKEEAIERCASMILEWNQTVPVSRHLSKMALRQPFIDALASRQESDTEEFVAICLDDRIQAMIGKYIKSLKNKSK